MIKLPFVEKDKIAIVVVGYNRIKSLSRLLNSLLAAKYSHGDIPLIISIDASGCEDLYEYVEKFEWPYGTKYVNIEKERLGLKKHIYQCGDLTKNFKAIILLEDDLFVSPYFYSYTEKVVDKYGEDNRIAEISLYKNESNGIIGVPFVNIQDGNDVFLMQDVSTWGQCWTENMWKSFVSWRDTHTEEDIQNVDMPERIKKWTRAWSKYFNAYVADTGKHVLFPNISLTTNFSDAGEHGGDNNSIVQVNLLQNDFDYRLNDLDKLVKYDIFANNELIYDWLGITCEELSLDLYGMRKSHNNKRYILSCLKLPYQVSKSFALNMRPIELNIKFNIEGNGIFLYDTTIPNKKWRKKEYSKELTPYFLQGFNLKLLIKYMVTVFPKTVMKKIFR